jgi:hypothetical protein
MLKVYRSEKGESTWTGLPTATSSQVNQGYGIGSTALDAIQSSGPCGTFFYLTGKLIRFTYYFDFEDCLVEDG